MSAAPTRIAYFPGCAMKDQARPYEEGALAALAALGVEVLELPRWNCCGTVYSLSQDDLMRHVGPVRNLVRAQTMGEPRLLTLCAMCYATLARSERFVREPERLARINAFMDDEPDYLGGVRVVHLLELLRDEIGFQALAAKTVRSLDGLRVAPYYGCTLLRPRAIGVDDPDMPTVMEDLAAALGATPVPFAERGECCGSFLTATSPEVVQERTGRILASARAAGAELIVTSCPLCQYNLGAHRPPAMPETPMVYLGELLAWALIEGACVPEPLRSLPAADACMGASA